VGRLVPVDDALDFHRWVGHALWWLGLAHAGAFVAAFARGHGAEALRWIVFTARGRTGLPLLAVFAVMWVCALGFIRRSRRFELFYFTHLLYVVWLALAVAHAPSFLFWAGVPLLGFVLEQLLRLVRRAPRASVVSSRALRSGVTRLEIARPPGFQFSPGDYAFLRIPAVARHEWHPFTISSAPERPELVFHVRALGNWTSALRKRVEGKEDAPDLFAYVDGPYGSPSAHIFESRVAVLIGAGIGVTPFASILEAIVARRNDAGTSKGAPKTALEKAYFFWLNNDQYSFEWFTALLSEVEKNDRDGLLDIHLCMTAARSGVSAMGLEVAREIMHASGRSDLITGLRTHTHFGSPNWKAMLGEIARRHQPVKVDVYFCGPPGLGTRLKPLCEGLGMRFREERF
ncbi:MAG TPA: ferric reductase-like transmembrane domain-containing protein, partial [Polyangiaceae bacterium]